MAPAIEDNNNSSSHGGIANPKLEKVFSMTGGKGEGSYAKNSQAQARHAKAMLHLLQETLDSVNLKPSGEFPFVVADLGCSSGRNTIDTVDFIIKHIAKRYEALDLQLPEFSIFFSDLPSNDFNTLFHLLPPFDTATAAAAVCGGAEENENNYNQYNLSYFSAGVPGSFYHRLFPMRSIDIFHSVFSLHWLSQVPESVVDKRSEAYNKGRIFIHGSNEATANEYKRQFQRDLASFLKSRSMEMKKGGSMFLAFLGRPSQDPTDQGGPGLLFGTHFQDAWDDLVQQGVISSEKRDSFNIPLYAASIEDFKQVVEEDGSFSINKLELFKGGSPLVVNDSDDADEIGQAMSNSCRSVSGVLVDAHFDHDHRIGNQIFSRLKDRATAQAKQIFNELQFFHIVASLSLAN